MITGYSLGRGGVISQYSMHGNGDCELQEAGNWRYTGLTLDQEFTNRSGNEQLITIEGNDLVSYVKHRHTKKINRRVVARR